MDAARFVPKLGLAVDFQERGRDWQSHSLPAIERSRCPKLKAKKIPKARERIERMRKSEFLNMYALLLLDDLKTREEAACHQITESQALYISWN